MVSLCWGEGQRTEPNASWEMTDVTGTNVGADARLSMLKKKGFVLFLGFVLLAWSLVFCVDMIAERRGQFVWQI